MSFFYTPEPTPAFPTYPSSFTHPRQHPHHHDSSVPYYVAQQLQPQRYNPFELNNHPPQPSAFPPHHPHHHHHEPFASLSYQSPQTLPFDPIEAHKQRLLAEFAQSLDQLYPSSTRQQHPAVAQPSYETERIRYLEARLKEEQLRKALEVERIRLAEAKEVERRQAEEQAEKQKQEKLHHADLVQQHRLQQQQQQKLAAEEEQQRRQFLEHRQQQRQFSGLGGLEQLFALLSGSEVPPQEVAEQATLQPQQKKTIAEHALGGLDQLLAFAQALENSPVPRAGEQQPTAEVASSSESKKAPQQTTSPHKPLPSSPLTTLRSLQTKLHSLLTSTASTATVLAHHLEKLLIDADGLESGGDEIVRSERRKFVQEVERVLESLEEKKPVASSSSPEEPSEVVAPAQEESTIPASNSPSFVVPSLEDSPSPSSPPVVDEVEVVASDPTPSPLSPPANSTPLPEPTPLTEPTTAPSDTTAPPAPLAPTPTPAPLDAPSTALDSDAHNDAASETSSNVSDTSSDAGEENRKAKGKGRAASVEDEEAEEERYEFI